KNNISYDTNFKNKSFYNIVYFYILITLGFIMKNNNYDSFHGIFTALITPFDTENNNINFSELAYLINFQIENNANGILLLGSTSESQSLSEKEKLDIVDFSLDIIEKKIPVIIGIN
ncbi:MAG: dihydrodipicolinate synthase family protein, partial [bacterium]